MITIRDITLSKTYSQVSNSDFRFQYVTEAKVQYGDKSYDTASIKLTDEQTQSLVDQIVTMLAANVTVALEQPERIDTAPLAIAAE